jgi:hypothetical protein
MSNTTTEHIPGIQASPWYLETKLSDACYDEHHCADCRPNGDCDRCFTIDGRWVEAVSEYASTCDANALN